MNWSIVKMVLVVACAALFTCAPAQGQQPASSMDVATPWPMRFPPNLPPMQQLPANSMDVATPAPPQAAGDGTLSVSTTSEGPVRVIHPDLTGADEADEPVPEPTRIWANANWWLAWIRGARFPTLVTQGMTADPLPGALGQEGTMVRFGGEPSPMDRQGARFQIGSWLDADARFGLELGGMFLASRSIAHSTQSPGAPAIARPFFNVNTQEQDASLVTFPALATGSVSVESGTRLYGTDATLLTALNCSQELPIRLLTGFRYLNLHDDLNIAEAVQLSGSAPVYAGQQIGVRDNFSCENSFYGGNLGLSVGYTIRRLEVEATVQCALGVGQEYVNIAGATSFAGPSGVQTIPAGLLAVGSNSGGHVRDVFAVVPEADFKARYEVTRHILLSVGYSFLNWNSVARAGQQVDTNVNPNLVPTSNTYGQPGGPALPQASIHDSDFWVHGVQCGLELRF